MSRNEANLAVSVVFQAQWDRWDKEITKREIKGPG
jgi:hypothetical protein